MDEQEIRRIISEGDYYATFKDYQKSRGIGVIRRMVAQRKSDGVRRSLGTLDALSRMNEEELAELLAAKFAAVKR